MVAFLDRGVAYNVYKLKKLLETKYEAVSMKSSDVKR